MNPEVKARWVAALRSGKFKQGHETLARILDAEDGSGTEIRHCCLGVLCELAAAEGIVTRRRNGNLGRIAFDDATAHLPGSVRKWASIVDGAGKFNPTDADFKNFGQTVTLVDLNDGLGLRAGSPSTFDEIADVIERYF